MVSTAELGEDLADLVRGLGRQLVDVIPLSHRGAPSVATAFQLRFADGTALKGSTLPGVENVTQVVALAPDLGPIVPRLIAHGGRAVLCEWVEGENLVGIEWSSALLRRCGAAQGRVHALGVAGAEPSQDVEQWRRKAFDGLDELVTSGLLAADEAARLAELAQRSAPISSATGISLGDYCPDNIVCRADGEPCLIDLETLTIAPPDFDLGRTWYRWPMNAAQRVAYLDGYRLHRDPSTFLAHLPFWYVTALVNGARFRHREHRPDLAVPLAGLRALLRDPASGV